MGILDDYGSLLDDPLRAKKAFMPPGTGPTSTLAGFMDPYGAQRDVASIRAGNPATNFGTGSPGFPPTKMDWKPTVTAPDSSVAKLQDRLGSGTDTSSFDIAQTFSPEPISGAKPAPSVASTPPTPTPPVMPPSPKVASAPLPPSRPPGVGGETPTPPSRPAGLLANVPLPPTRPTGVPTTAPPPSLTAAAEPPPRPLGDSGGSPLTSNPVTAINNITPPPVIPASTIGSPIGDFQKGGEFGDVAPGGDNDLGSGLGGDMGNGSDDLGGGGGGGGGMDLAAGESGGGGDGGGGGGGGLGGILGAIGGLAKGLGGGGGGGAQAPAPPVPVAKAPQLAPMAGDPGMAKRAQGAQQIVSGLLADPSLIDPKKKQTGLLA